MNGMAGREEIPRVARFGNSVPWLLHRTVWPFSGDNRLEKVRESASDKALQSSRSTSRADRGRPNDPRGDPNSVGKSKYRFLVGKEGDETNEALIAGARVELATLSVKS